MAEKKDQQSKARIVKPVPLSGFVEFSPQIQLHLENILADFRALFSSYGFVPIDTPVVERMEVLAAKGGDVDKEIYTLKRIHDTGDSKAEFALRYDLTVPLARYVAAHFNELVFPFKRFHIAECWRGERPQDGRYRQFKQADIDVVNLNDLPLSFDAEIPLLVGKALKILGVDDFVFRISNRKILCGYLEALGVEDIQAVTRILDKLAKLGEEAVLLMLKESGLSAERAEKALSIAQISAVDSSFVEKIEKLGVSHPLLSEGIEELKYVMERLQAEGDVEFLADLSVTRGFDYYTGSVYEVQWNRFPGIGSIAAGGRYDNLASSFIRHKIPGVGMSVGVTRIFGKMVQEGLIAPKRKTSTDLLIVREENSQEADLHKTADELRARKINVEVYYRLDDLARQLRYADKKGIRYVLFPQLKEVKDLQKGQQAPFDLKSFVLPER